MVKIIAENEYGESILLTGNSNYQVVSISGITPPKATINTTRLATQDGSIFNSSFLQNRNIVMKIQPVRNIEQSRLNLYKFFKVKNYVKLSFRTSRRTVWTEGYVESLEIDLNENPQFAQISIICPDPWLKAEDPIITLFDEGSATVNNPSDETSGAVFELQATGEVVVPEIINTTTMESFAINKTMANGDKIILNTRRGEKGLWFVHNGEITNIINYMIHGSSWISLRSGENFLDISAQDGDANLGGNIMLEPIFEGV